MEAIEGLLQILTALKLLRTDSFLLFWLFRSSKLWASNNFNPIIMGQSSPSNFAGPAVYFVLLDAFWLCFTSISLITIRSSHQRCFVKKGVFRNFAKFTGKHLCQNLFFNKVAGGGACNFIKQETLAQVFSYEFCEISKNTFFTEHAWVTASLLFYVLHWLDRSKKVLRTLELLPDISFWKVAYFILEI